MQFEEVKNFIEENKETEEVKSYLQELNPLTVEGVKGFIESDANAKSWIDSVKDKHLSKGLETWKTNNLEKMIDEEVKKRFPEKDEKDIEVEKLRAEVEKMQFEKQREVLTNKAIKIANEKHLPINLVDFFIAENEEVTEKNLSVLESVFSQSVQIEVEKRLKGDGYTPPKGEKKSNITLDAIKTMSQKEINENWNSVKELLKNKK
ncbi:DUF4355 domain-containing protein [Haloimpatiens massiliensis]|jgi:hypothetical protein|uniref:DUF4355 domain-containing protein n=1 Tax=Haloimpatiens massiliensis TaxID=1658110 RepID=UPI000C8639EE|nr:DUF4355 domain-containing protein [Haloimpatiens massiliensis]